MKQLILIAEDEAAVITMLRYNLEKEGYQVCEAGDGEEALNVASEQMPSLILLDWMLPRVSGIEVCRQLRRNPELRDIPIMMLTARGEESDVIRALNIGADDYVVKPFSLPELLARIRALLRRNRSPQDKGVLSYADIVLDQTSHRVSRSGRPLHLGPTEYRLLQFLMQNPECVFSRETLLRSIWGHDIYVEVRTVDVHIRRLRKTLNQNGLPDLIRTVRAAGYAIDMADARDDSRASD